MSNRSDLHLHYFTIIPFTSYALDVLLHLTFHFLRSPCLPSNDVELRYIMGKTAELLDALKKFFFKLESTAPQALLSEGPQRYLSVRVVAI